MSEVKGGSQGDSAAQLYATRGLRERARLPLMLAGPALVLAVVGYLYLTGGRHETTDDAYVQAARVAISADIGGRVKEVAVRDNQSVHKGDVLFRLDEAPLRIAVEEATAQIAAARLKVETLKATYRQRQAEVVAARDSVKYRQTEQERQLRLAESGIAAQAQVDQAAHALSEARAQLAGAEQQLGAVVASLGGNPDIAPERHPDVLQAQALVDRARLNLSYATVKAPADGIVARVATLQPGSYVNAATPVFALVAAQELWIEANFKEDQLAHMRPGQPATVRIDTYEGRTFAARVGSVSPGTGAQFSVLPAENASGNWVKVVQRVPVRIELERSDAALPLHAGLSAEVSVDTGHERHLFGGGEQAPAAATGAAK